MNFFKKHGAMRCSGNGADRFRYAGAVELQALRDLLGEALKKPLPEREKGHIRAEIARIDAEMNRRAVSATATNTEKPHV